MPETSPVNAVDEETQTTRSGTIQQNVDKTLTIPARAGCDIHAISTVYLSRCKDNPRIKKSDNKRLILMRNQLRELERGQSLVEMSIGFVLLLILLSGLLDVGRAYFVYIAMEDGAGEAALYLSIDPECRTTADSPVDNPTLCADPNNAEYRARSAGGGNLNWSDATIRIVRPTCYGVGDPVEVTIEYSVKLITPFLPRFAGINPLPMRVQATQTIIRETDISPCPPAP